MLQRCAKGRVYATAEEAKNNTDRQRRRQYGFAGRGKPQPWHCSECEGWHVTEGKGRPEGISAGFDAMHRRDEPKNASGRQESASERTQIAEVTSPYVGSPATPPPIPDPVDPHTMPSTVDAVGATLRPDLDAEIDRELDK
jgi:hypothetical protein